MINIIIPAHNEQKLIAKTLDFLLADETLTHCQIIVVCNGCSDNTAVVIGNFLESNDEFLARNSINLSVIETEEASKTHAINLGIEHSSGFPIVLLDADIHISGEHLIKVVNSLSERVLVASPKLDYDVSNSSNLVKAYYQIVSHSLYNQKHRISNVIALSELAIKHIGKLPEVIADDEYIRKCFHHSEYCIEESASFTFHCPRNLINLLNVLTRVERGNLQLKKLNIADNTQVHGLGVPMSFSFGYLIFVFCKLTAKFRAKWQYKHGKVKQWERDESNR